MLISLPSRPAHHKLSGRGWDRSADLSINRSMLYHWAGGNGNFRHSVETDDIMDQDDYSVSSDDSDEEDDVLEDVIPRVPVPRRVRR